MLFIPGCNSPASCSYIVQSKLAVTTDASDVAMGAILNQIQEGEKGVVAYWSRQLSKVQQSHSTTEQEALTVVSSIKESCPYLYGFHSQTKHAKLLLRCKWCMLLSRRGSTSDTWTCLVDTVVGKVLTMSLEGDCTLGHGRGPVAPYLTPKGQRTGRPGCQVRKVSQRVYTIGGGT